MKAESAVHHAMVGDREGLHVQFSGSLHEVFNAAQAVEEGILTVDMKMDKLSHCVLLLEVHTSGEPLGPIIAQTTSQ
jgi:FixJ family two-component response regulator